MSNLLDLQHKRNPLAWRQRGQGQLSNACQTSLQSESSISIQCFKPMSTVLYAAMIERNTANRSWSRHSLKESTEGLCPWISELEKPPPHSQRYFSCHPTQLPVPSFQDDKSFQGRNFQSTDPIPCCSAYPPRDGKLLDTIFILCLSFQYLCISIHTFSTLEPLQVYDAVMLKLIADVSDILYVALHGAFYIEEHRHGSRHACRYSRFLCIYVWLLPPRPKTVHEQFTLAMKAPSHAQDSKKQSTRLWLIHLHEDPQFAKFPWQLKICDNKFILNIFITLSQLVVTRLASARLNATQTQWGHNLRLVFQKTTSWRKSWEGFAGDPSNETWLFKQQRNNYMPQCFSTSEQLLQMIVLTTYFHATLKKIDSHLTNAVVFAYDMFCEQKRTKSQLHLCSNATSWYQPQFQ